MGNKRARVSIFCWLAAGFAGVAGQGWIAVPCPNAVDAHATRRKALSAQRFRKEDLLIIDLKEELA